MKKIIVEIDENKNARIAKSASMKPDECISALLAAGVWYYKKEYGMDSIYEATKAVGVELIKSVGSFARVH